MPTDRDGPGPAKVREPHAVRPRSLRLVSVLDGWWARNLAQADVISEGAVVYERGQPVYYGTTSVHCRAVATPSVAPALGGRELALLVLADPHARLRLLRLARREATARAPAPLGVVYTEMTARAVPDRRGDVIEIGMDVSAAVQDAASLAASK